MAKLFLDSTEQGIVVFKIWKALGYKTRIILFSSLIIIGLGWQLFSRELFPGVILVFLSNLLLLPSGFDNRVKIGRYDPASGWEKVERSKLDEFLALDKKIRKWDVSSLDISNGLGCFFFLLVAGGLVIFFLVSLAVKNKALVMISINAAALLIPFWVTGLRSKFTVPEVTGKCRVIIKLLAMPELQPRLARHKVDYFFLLGGEEKVRVPGDVKFRVNIENQHADFLGLYGQVVMNHVQSTPYPYFYMVLVAKQGYGLDRVFESYQPAKNIIKEYKVQGEAQVLVIRQNTRQTAGYYTHHKHVYQIFLEGLSLAEKAAVK